MPHDLYSLLTIPNVKPGATGFTDHATGGHSIQQIRSNVRGCPGVLSPTSICELHNFHLFHYLSTVQLSHLSLGKAWIHRLLAKLPTHPMGTPGPSIYPIRCLIIIVYLMEMWSLRDSLPGCSEGHSIQNYGLVSTVAPVCFPL